jgi:hypothetical protein
MGQEFVIRRMDGSDMNCLFRSLAFWKVVRQVDGERGPRFDRAAARKADPANAPLIPGTGERAVMNQIAASRAAAKAKAKVAKIREKLETVVNSRPSNADQRKLVERQTKKLVEELEAAIAVATAAADAAAAGEGGGAAGGGGGGGGGAAGGGGGGGAAGGGGGADLGLIPAHEYIRAQIVNQMHIHKADIMADDTFMEGFKAAVQEIPGGAPPGGDNEAIVDRYIRHVSQLGHDGGNVELGIWCQFVEPTWRVIYWTKPGNRGDIQPAEMCKAPEDREDESTQRIEEQFLHPRTAVLFFIDGVEDPETKIKTTGHYDVLLDFSIKAAEAEASWDGTLRNEIFKIPPDPAMPAAFSTMATRVGINTEAARRAVWAKIRQIGETSATFETFRDAVLSSPNPAEDPPRADQVAFKARRIFECARDSEIETKKIEFYKLMANGDDDDGLTVALGTTRRVIRPERRVEAVAVAAAPPPAAAPADGKAVPVVASVGESAQSRRRPRDDTAEAPPARRRKTNQLSPGGDDAAPAEKEEVSLPSQAEASGKPPPKKSRRKG